jgi:hypothetical protein
MKRKPAVFWQTERLLSVFFKGTEKKGFTGFFLQHVKIEEGIRARTGLIFLWICIPVF